MSCFDWKFYLNNNPDLIKNGINTPNKALRHWNNFGRNEGRICSPNKPTPTKPLLVEDFTITNKTLLVAKCGILDQGSLGACGANSITVAISITSLGTINNLCRLYVNFNTKCLDQISQLSNIGVSTRNLLKSLVEYSGCDESLFPYISQNYFRQPPLVCYKNTITFQNFQYYDILQDINILSNIINALNNNKGIVVGISVYTSFPLNNTTKGLIQMPNLSIDKLIEYHCVALVGYCMINGANYIILQNSWGNKWGDNGYGYIPIEYITSTILSERPTVISFN
jgi:C1A family cysteine protease